VSIAVDYTKGYSGAVLAHRAADGKASQSIGKFTFLQVGRLASTRIKRYHDLGAEIGAGSRSINKRFQVGKWQPICVDEEATQPPGDSALLSIRDLCMVTSLHDGMNLVAKNLCCAPMSWEC